MTYDNISTERDGAIGILTFQREKVLNALSPGLIADTNAAMKAFTEDDAVRAIVVKGAGRAFSAGFDMAASAGSKRETPAQWEEVLQYDFDFIMQFWDCPKPTVSAVHGYCLAGAFEVALACDVTVAAESTRFGEPEVRFSSGIVAMLMPWMTGPKQAKELLLTGNDRITAQQAYDFGLVNRVVPDGKEVETAMNMARDMAASAAHSVKMTKRAINRSYDMMGMRDALRMALDIDVLIESTMTEEKAEFKLIREEEGLKAALAWRDAKFKRG